MKQLTDKDFFFCYTVTMSMYLKEKGFSYLFKFRSIKEGNSICTLYQKSPELQQALDEYGNQ